jgi:hypothetical protein
MTIILIETTDRTLMLRQIDAQLAPTPAEYAELACASDAQAVVQIALQLRTDVEIDWREGR